MRQTATAPASDPNVLRTDLAAYIREHIPLTRAMGLEVAAIDDAGLTLAAPLAPNVNDKGTVFGGSLAAALTLAGWGMTRLLLILNDLAGDVVVTDSAARYLAPAGGDFSVTCPWPEPALTEAFLAGLRQRGRARLEAACQARAGNRVVATCTGRYAALNPSGATA